MKIWSRLDGCQLFYYDEAGFAASPPSATRLVAYWRAASAGVCHGRWMTEFNTVLCYIPPYRPELNRLKILWKQAKYHWREFVTWSKDTFRDKVRELLDRLPGGNDTLISVPIPPLSGQALASYVALLAGIGTVLIIMRPDQSVRI